MWSKQAAHLSCVLDKDLEWRHELIAADDTDAVLLIDASIMLSTHLTGQLHYITSAFYAL